MTAPAAPVQCIACRQANLKRDKRMTAQGFTACDAGQVGRYQSLTAYRECHSFRIADETTICKRVEWMTTRDNKAKGATT